MFLLWKSPGGSKRYRSNSHKSRRKPDADIGRQITPTIVGRESSEQSRVCLPSSSFREVQTTSRQIFFSISTSASKNESISSSVMLSPVRFRANKSVKRTARTLVLVIHGHATNGTQICQWVTWPMVACDERESVGAYFVCPLCLGDDPELYERHANGWQSRPPGEW